MNRIEVLDHGWVALIEATGDDNRVAEAARNATATSDTYHTWNDNAGLTRRLFSDRHTSPFEFIDVTFEVHAPIFVARQLVRHRTANWAEFSGRYSNFDKIGMDYYVPTEWRGKPTRAAGVNLQGSIADAFNAEQNRLFTESYIKWVEHGLRLYRTFAEAGVANEMARFFIPITGYTNWWWKNDFHNWLKTLNLRVETHAQWETRQYAIAIADIMRQQYPKLMDVVFPLERQLVLSGQKEPEPTAVERLIERLEDAEFFGGRDTDMALFEDAKKELANARH